MRKAAICNSLLKYFVEQKILKKSAVEFLEEREVGSKFSEQLAMKKLEIEEREKSREFELELKKDVDGRKNG